MKITVCESKGFSCAILVFEVWQRYKVNDTNAKTSIFFVYLLKVSDSYRHCACVLIKADIIFPWLSTCWQISEVHTESNRVVFLRILDFVECFSATLVHSKRNRRSTKMRLFIWNDRRWDIVDENADYDKLNYAVVRKLFIKWLKSVSTSWIKRLTSIQSQTNLFARLFLLV